MSSQDRAKGAALSKQPRLSRASTPRGQAKLSSAGRISGALVCLLALLGGVSEPAQAELALTFGAYSSDKPSAMVAQIRPSLNEVARDMSAVLGEAVEISMQVVRSYEDGVGLVVSGRVDFARLGAASYVAAIDQNPDLEILAMENKRGSKSFRGVICVRQDSDITELGQLKGRSFAFGNTRSTLGRYLAQLTLFNAGILAEDLDHYEYLGRHDKVGRAIGSGLFDGGAVEETVFAKLVKQGVPIRAIATYTTATKPWVARQGLDPRIKQALRQALLNLREPSALQALRFDGFLAGDDSDFEDTRLAIQENPRFFAPAQ
jgi:phosphonate transport system substrate-binding protein